MTFRSKIITIVITNVSGTVFRLSSEQNTTKILCDKLSLPIFAYSGAEVFAMRFFVLQKTVCVFIPDFQPFLTVYIKATEKEGIN